MNLARELAERTLVHPEVQAPFAFYRAATALLATLDAWSADPARAVERFSAIEADARADGGAATAFYLAEYVEALLELGRLDEARATLTMWERASRKLGHRWAIPQTVRCRGLAAAAEGDIAAAMELLAQAVAEHEAVDDPFGRARALLALGVTRRRARQKRSAREAVEAALAGFEEIGAAGWAEKARGSWAGSAAASGRKGSHRPSAASPSSSRKGRRTERSRRRSSSVSAPSRPISRTSMRSSASARGRSSPARWAEQGSGVPTFPRDAAVVASRHAELSRRDVSCQRPRRKRRRRERRASSAAEELTKRGTPVRFANSIHVPEDEICFFVFDAPSGPAAALAAEQACLDPFRVVEVVTSGKEEK